MTSSASGLDPDISPANAAIQVDRVARARGTDPATIEAMVATATAGRELGFLGDPTVDVGTLNAALDRRFGAAGG